MFTERNKKGEKVLEFCQSKEMMLANTIVFKKEKETITYNNGGTETN